MLLKFKKEKSHHKFVTVSSVIANKKKQTQKRNEGLTSRLGLALRLNKLVVREEDESEDNVTNAREDGGKRQFVCRTGVLACDRNHNETCCDCDDAILFCDFVC